MPKPTVEPPKAILLIGDGFFFFFVVGGCWLDPGHPGNKHGDAKGCRTISGRPMSKLLTLDM